MTVTIEFPPELERKLDESARRKGTTPGALVLTIVRNQLLAEEETESPNPAPRNLAEYLADHIGVLSSVKDGVSQGDLSERTGERYKEILLEREAQRRG